MSSWERDKYISRHKIIQGGILNETIYQGIYE